MVYVLIAMKLFLSVASVQKHLPEHSVLSVRSSINLVSLTIISSTICQELIYAQCAQMANIWRVNKVVRFALKL